MRALVLAPHPADRDPLCEVLVGRGWQVDVAGCAEEGRRVLADRRPDLLVMDHELPDGTAADLCRAVRASPRGSGTVLLVLTHRVTPGTLQELADAGADDYLPYPIDPSRLAGRVAFLESRLFGAGAGRGEGRSASPAWVAELQEALGVQKALLDELFRNAPEGIAVVDEHDWIVHVNPEFSRMFGYGEEEARGRLINDLIVPDDRMEEAQVMTHGVRQGQRFMLDTVRRRRDGSRIDVSVLVTPVRGPAGPLGAYAIYRDITEHKAYERALQESEARYRALFDQSPVGVFLCDAELTITHCNERLTQITRVPYSDLVGSSLLDLQDDRILPGLAQAQMGETAFYEGPYRTRLRGFHLWISVRYAPLRAPDGTIIGGIGVVEDISDRERAQQELRAQAAEVERVNAALHERTLELESALQARSRLYSAMNHELRTPISAIMLYQELLMAETLGPLNAEQHEALDRSHTAAGHLLELVQEVLDLSKIEAGKVSVHPVEVYLPGLLEDLHATVLPLARRYGSEVILEVDPAHPPVVTDPQRVRQVLLNLGSNAAKYGRGRPIVIRCYPVAGGGSAMEVRDRGIGIAAADLSRIFEDFVQLGSGQQEGGTGLGLAISRRLAQLLGGHLEVESALGEGSTFRLVIPSLPVASGDNLQEEEVQV